MNSYLAFLRGINVGGHGLIKMIDLKDVLSHGGLVDAQTYIQSGNVIFKSNEIDTDKLAELISALIDQKFKLTVGVAVFSKQQWQKVINNVPAWWGKDKSWKHNLLILIKPHTPTDVLAAMVELKREIEAVEAGEGVVYQSMSLTMFGRTSSSKLVTNPVYKQLTIRNYNTATKLLTLL